MDWSELSSRSKVRIENNSKGVLDITSKSNNIDIAIEKALDKLYYNIDGKKFITLEINRTLIFLDRFDDPESSTLIVLGRRYKNNSDIFLTRTISLGKVNVDSWEDYNSFSAQMTALLKVWIRLVKEDKELNANYQW